MQEEGANAERVRTRLDELSDPEYVARELGNAIGVDPLTMSRVHALRAETPESLLARSREEPTPLPFLVLAEQHPEVVEQVLKAQATAVERRMAEAAARLIGEIDRTLGPTRAEHSRLQSTRDELEERLEASRRTQLERRAEHTALGRRLPVRFLTLLGGLPWFGAIVGAAMVGAFPYGTTRPETAARMPLGQLLPH